MFVDQYSASKQSLDSDPTESKSNDLAMTSPTMTTKPPDMVCKASNYRRPLLSDSVFVSDSVRVSIHSVGLHSTVYVGVGRREPHMPCTSLQFKNS